MRILIHRMEEGGMQVQPELQDKKILIIRASDSNEVSLLAHGAYEICLQEESTPSQLGAELLVPHT